MSDDLRKHIADFLAAHTTMTLATGGADGAPQAAAVFYAPDDELNLYFLSEPTSRHARNLTAVPRVAATIQADGQDWQQICGLQIEGMAALVEDVGEMAHAAQVYAARFDFLAGLLTGTGEGAPALVGPLVRSRFYVLRPRWLRLIDNRVHFGYKEELWLGQRGDESALGCWAGQGQRVTRRRGPHCLGARCLVASLPLTALECSDLVRSSHVHGV